MAERIIISWRDIPAQLIVRQGRKAEKRELPSRFIVAIDRCAMRIGAHESEAYLAQWRRWAPTPCGDDLVAEANAAFAELESAYDEARLAALVEAEGWAT